MQIEYGCCVVKDIKFFKGFTEEKGCVVMCPVCHKILATVGHQADMGVYAWIDKAIKNGLYFAAKGGEPTNDSLQSKRPAGT